MLLHLTAPPANVQDNIKNLDEVLTRDDSGETTGRIASFLAEASLECKQARLRSADDEVREIAALSADALMAAHAILLASWSDRHQRELPRALLLSSPNPAT